MSTFQGIKLLVLVIGFLTFIGIDLVWLAFLMRDFYAEKLADTLRMVDGTITPNWLPALCAWALIVFGLYIFVLPRSFSIVETAGYAALYGFIVYGVYNLTNYATLTHWPLEVMLADIFWGTIINALVGMIMKFIQKNI